MRKYTLLLIAFFFLSCNTVSNEYLTLAVEYYELGQLYEQESREESSIIPLYTKALDFYPAFEEAAYSLAILYINSGDYERAQEIIDAQGIIAGNNALLANLRAYLAISRSNFDTAEEIYLKLIEDEDATYDTYHNLGLIYVQGDREDDAVDMFNEAIALSSNFIPSHEQLALFSFQKMDYLDVIVRLEGFADMLDEFPLAAIILGESFIDSESYVGLFALMENLYTRHEGGSEIPQHLLERYEELLVETAQLLASIAIDDERSLRYFTIVDELALLSSSEWNETLASLENIKGIDETLAFITDAAERASTEAETDPEDETDINIDPEDEADININPEDEIDINPEI